MEGHIRQIYTQAQGELTEKWVAYMERGRARLSDLYSAYLSAPADKKAAALKKYQEALQNFTFRNKWYKDMVRDTTYRLANVNSLAISYVNGEIPAIYARNYNQINSKAFLVKSNWILRSEHTVAGLIRETLPETELNFAKDMAWNTKSINSAVLQGILQGESMDKISARIFPEIMKTFDISKLTEAEKKSLIKKNQNAAIRTARTMVTRAENRGRQDRYQEYEDEGLIVHKVWIATPDNRVRDWHLSMDGQEVPINDMFVDGHGEELMYPGDTENGSARTTYNCRCSMRSQLIGIRGKDGKITEIGVNYGSSLHQRQIIEERARRAGIDPDELEW